MDSVIFGFLREELEFFFEDFNKESLNTSFLKGDVELQNLKLNTAVIQDLLSPVVPFVEIEKAVVSKLRLQVPFTSLKTKPTTVNIDRIDVFLKEPITPHEVQNLLRDRFKIKEGGAKKTGKYEYTLPDRVLDGLSVVINHIHLTFALNGKFRNAQKGLWTPHVLDINIYDFELYSTNENWERVDLQATRAYTHGKDHVWVFKEVACKLSCRLVPHRDDNTSFRKTGVLREPVSFFDKLPIKARITSQRLNAAEKIGTEISLFVGSTQVNLTARHLSHVAQWAEALAEAFIREDLKGLEEQSVKPPESNLLLNVILDQFKVVLVEENGDTKTESVAIQLDGLQINKFTDMKNPADGGVRFLLSQLSLTDLIQERNLFHLLRKPESKSDIVIPLPESVYVHPVHVPLPNNVHLCGEVIARFPAPKAPAACFEYKIKTYSSELVVERDGIERLIAFILQAHLSNSELPLPSESDYADPKFHKEEAQLKLFNVEENGIYYEMDLLPSKDALIKFDCTSEELKVIFPSPGGADKPHAEFVCTHVRLTGDPLLATLPFNQDFLDFTSPSGIPLVQPGDFFYNKFHLKSPEYTPKFQVELPEISINWVSKAGEAGDSICKLTDTKALFKIYSMRKYISDPTVIPQIEADVHIKDANFIVLENQHTELLGFLKDHFLYGASSEVKEMLEREVKKLATDLNPRPRGYEYLVKNKILKLPTYLLNISTDRVFLGLKDKTGKELFNMLLTDTGSITEKHADRQVVMGKLGNVRVWAVAEEEKSLLRVVKKSLKDVSYTRTEWRTFTQGKSRRGGEAQPKCYLLGNTDGIQVNFNMDSVYNCLDYLVNILGDTIILAEETAGSNYMAMMGKYAEILFLTGLPSEANNYWRNLREVSLFAEQLQDMIGEVVWDVNFSNFDITFGDDNAQFKPFTFDALQITSSGEPGSGKETTAFKIVGIQGNVVTKEGKKEPLSVPFDFVWECNSESNPEWNNSSPLEVPKYIRKCDITTTPAVSVHLSPSHFKLASEFFASHIETFRKTTKRLMEKVEDKTKETSSVVSLEDATTTAQGLIARNTSPNNVNALKKALAASNKIVADAQSIQFDLSSKNADLQMKNMELEGQVSELQSKVKEMEIALQELQTKLVNLQLAQLSGL
eukprot:TRINITY_DN16836_c0_g1_i1.p1 TRINITY_DN16836_c0_g1~~TRINITY_DN16836_c0_g1_i1.p1  ORF type:complete len:1165 (+),score=314.03 TRINITY_DN16836_c0_g1_i1:65-3496(+)